MVELQSGWVSASSPGLKLQHSWSYHSQKEQGAHTIDINRVPGSDDQDLAFLAHTEQFLKIPLL